MSRNDGDLKGHRDTAQSNSSQYVEELLTRSYAAGHQTSIRSVSMSSSAAKPSSRRVAIPIPGMNVVKHSVETEAEQEDAILREACLKQEEDDEIMAQILGIAEAEAEEEALDEEALARAIQESLQVTVSDKKSRPPPENRLF